VSHVPSIIFLGGVGFYVLGGYLLSGVVVYKIFGDISNLSPLIRILIVFALITFVTTIFSWIYGVLIHPTVVDVLREGRFRFNDVIEIDGSLSSQILLMLLVMFSYSFLTLTAFLFWSITPLCVLLASLLQPKNAKD
jgi:hypothetical protein